MKLFYWRKPWRGMFGPVVIAVAASTLQEATMMAELELRRAYNGRDLGKLPNIGKPTTRELPAAFYFDPEAT